MGTEIRDIFPAMSFDAFGLIDPMQLPNFEYLPGMVADCGVGSDGSSIYSLSASASGPVLDHLLDSESELHLPASLSHANPNCDLLRDTNSWACDASPESLLHSSNDKPEAAVEEVTHDQSSTVPENTHKRGRNPDLVHRTRASRSKQWRIKHREYVRSLEHAHNDLTAKSEHLEDESKRLRIDIERLKAELLKKDNELLRLKISIAEDMKLRS